VAAVQVQVVDASGKPLPQAVVTLDSPAARRAARPAAGVEIAQQDKRFIPEVMVVTVGTAVQFPNRDTVRHHVYSISPAKTFDIKLYVGTPANPVVFDRPGVAVLGCNIHSEMAGWVVVVETPHHGRSDERGRVSVAEVPPGRYTLHAWHPDLPLGQAAVAQAVDVTASGGAWTVRLPVSAE
jgi:plastocyanin